MSRVQTTARTLVRTLRPQWHPARLASSSAASPSAFDQALAGTSAAALFPRGAAAAQQQPTASTSRAPLAASPSSPSSSSSLPSSSVPLPRGPAAVDPDAELLGVLARLIMRDGKLARAHAFLATCLADLQLATGSPPLPILRRAVDLASPSIRMVGRRKGTKVMPTPQPLTAKQRRRQAWLWIVDASDKRQSTEKDFGKRLALEVLAVLNGQSEALKKLAGIHTLGVTGRANVGR